MTTTSNPEGDVTDLEEVPRGAASTPTPAATCDVCGEPLGEGSRPHGRHVRCPTPAAIPSLEEVDTDALDELEDWMLEEAKLEDGRKFPSAAILWRQRVDTLRALHAAATEGAKAKEELARIDAARREVGQ
jgi:hypothetical protein